MIETDSAEEDGGDVEAPPADTPVEQQIEAETPGAEQVSVAEVASPAPEPVAAPTPAPAPAPVAATDHGKAVLASPAVRARAKDLGVDLGEVHADGDRIRHADLDAFLRYSGGQGYHAPGASRARADEPIKVIGMRRKIAENMAAAKRAIPHFTYDDVALPDRCDLPDDPAVSDDQRALR